MTNAIGHHPLCTWFGKTTNSCRLCMRLHLDYPLTKVYRIEKVQCWTDSRHHLIDANGVVVCKTDSAMIVDMWRKQYSIDEASK